MSTIRASTQTSRSYSCCVLWPVRIHILSISRSASTQRIKTSYPFFKDMRRTEHMLTHSAAHEHEAVFLRSCVRPLTETISHTNGRSCHRQWESFDPVPRGCSSSRPRRMCVCCSMCSLCCCADVGHRQPVPLSAQNTRSCAHEREHDGHHTFTAAVNA